MFWQMTGVASSSFGEPSWLRFMLSPLDRQLMEIFTDQTTPGTPLRDRERFIAALFTLAEFMRNAGFARGTVENWNELGLALFELKRGTVRHFLTPDKPSSRPVDPGDIWLARAHVAAALDLVVRDGRKATEASEQIARSFAYLQPILSPTSNDFAGTIRKWRNDFRAEKVLDARSARVFAERHFIEEYMRLTLVAKGESASPSAVSALILYDAGMIAGRAAPKKAIVKFMAGPARSHKRLIKKRKL